MYKGTHSACYSNGSLFRSLAFRCLAVVGCRLRAEPKSEGKSIGSSTIASASLLSSLISPSTLIFRRGCCVLMRAVGVCTSGGDPARCHIRVAVPYTRVRQTVGTGSSRIIIFRVVLVFSEPPMASLVLPRSHRSQVWLSVSSSCSPRARALKRSR